MLVSFFYSKRARTLQQTVYLVVCTFEYDLSVEN